MNVRMMPPQGPMGQPMPQGGSPAPMGPPMGGPPPQMPMGGPMPQQSSGKGQGLGATFGGSAAGRGQFKQFMSSKKQQAPSMQVPQMPMAPAMPQSPMLPPPMPTNMGPMKPMGAPNMGGGAPQLGRQAPVGGGIGSAPMGVASNTNAVRGFADGGSVPRQTEIAGQPHYLAYINPEEGDILKGLGGAEAPGPGGIPSYFFHSGWGGGGSTSTSSNDDDDDDGGFSFSDWASDTWAEITSGGEAVTDTYNSGDSVSSGQNNNPNAGDGGGTSGGYSGDEFGSGNIYTETTPGASTVNFGNTVSYDDDNDDDYSYTDTSSISGISDASGGLEVRSLDSGIQYYVDEAGAFVGLVPEDDNSLDPFGGAGPDISNDYVTNDGGISYTYDPIVSGGTGTTTAGTGGYDGSTYDEVPDVGAGTELDTTVSDYENEAYGGAIEDYYNPPPSDDGGSDSVSVPDPAADVGGGPGAEPVYFDMFGGQHSTLDAANEADKNYLDSEQSGIDLLSQSDGQAGYTVGGYDYQGPDYTAPDVDTGPSQYEIDASNNTAKLMNDYSVISDDYSNFQGIDLTTQDANTIGYATGGSKAGYSAVINPSTGGIDILTPGSQGVERSFAATELEDALNFLTDGDIDLTNLDAPLDLLPEASGGTGTVGLDAEGRLIEYGTEGTEDIGVGATEDDLATDFSVVPTGVGATDDDLATDFSAFDTTGTDSSVGGYDEAGLNAFGGLLNQDYTDLTDSGFQGLDLTEGGNTIGYATSGKNAGSAAIATYDGRVEILGPGATKTDVSFDTVDEAIDYLTDSGGDVGATDDDLATDFSTVSTETEKDLAFQNYLDGLVDTDFTDPEQTGLEAMEGDISDLPDNIQNTNILSDFDISELEIDAEDFMNSFDGKTEDELIADQGIMMPSDEAFARAEEDMSGLDILAEAALSGDTDDDTDVVVAKTREQKIDDLVAAGVDRTLAEASIDSLEGGVNVDDGTSAAELRDTLVEQVMSTQPTASELYLSAMGKVGSGISDFSPEEQRALYGARGQTPNAAETAYLQSLLRDVKHTSDGPIDEREYITEPTTYASTYNTETGKFEGSDQVTGGGGVIANPNFGKPMYEAGDSVAEQTLGETVEDFFVKAFDIFVNPLTIFGDDYTLEGANARNVQAQLDAYKNGGTFVYGDDGATVIGVAQPNFDASGDGNNDTVVLINDDGEITVSSDAIAAVDIENSNKNSGLDSEVDDIDLIDSGTTFTNTEDGVVQESAFDDIVVGGDDSGADPCPEGFYLDPVTGICMPMDDIGDVGDTSGGGISIGGINRGGSGFDYITGGVPSDAKGLKIKTPKQFNRGGMVSPNIDRFIQSLAS